MAIRWATPPSRLAPWPRHFGGTRCQFAAVLRSAGRRPAAGADALAAATAPPPCWQPVGRRSPRAARAHAGIAQPVPPILAAAQPLHWLSSDAAQPHSLRSTKRAQRSGDRLAAACPCCVSRVRRRPHPAEPAADKPRRDRAWQGSARQAARQRALDRAAPAWQAQQGTARNGDRRQRYTTGTARGRNRIAPPSTPPCTAPSAAGHAPRRSHGPRGGLSVAVCTSDPATLSFPKLKEGPPTIRINRDALDPDRRDRVIQQVIPFVFRDTADEWLMERC